MARYTPLYALSYTRRVFPILTESRACIDNAEKLRKPHRLAIAIKVKVFGLGRARLLGGVSGEARKLRAQCRWRMSFNDDGRSSHLLCPSADNLPLFTRGGLIRLSRRPFSRRDLNSFPTIFSPSLPRRRMSIERARPRGARLLTQLSRVYPRERSYPAVADADDAIPPPGAD